METESKQIVGKGKQKKSGSNRKLTMAYKIAQQQMSKEEFETIFFGLSAGVQKKLASKELAEVCMIIQGVKSESFQAGLNTSKNSPENAIQPRTASDYVSLTNWTARLKKARNLMKNRLIAVQAAIVGIGK